MEDTIRFLTSREFARNLSSAKRTAAACGTVIVTDRGEPTFALLNIAEYRRLTTGGKNMAELLAMPESDAINFDPEPIKIEPRDLGSR